jgi:hypothetical protein
MATADELPADMMPLAEAARIAHRQVFSGTLQMSPDALDLIATALSGHLPIYGVRHNESGLKQITESEYSRGSFRAGATRFEFRDNQPPITGLALQKADLTRFLQTATAPRGDPKQPK